MSVFHVRRYRDSTMSWLDGDKCCLQISVIKVRAAPAAGYLADKRLHGEQTRGLAPTPQSTGIQATSRAHCAVRLMLPDAGLPGASSQLFEGRRGESVSAASTTGQWRVLTG